MPKELLNDKFLHQIGNRISFIGNIESVKTIESNGLSRKKWQVLISDIEEKNSHTKFRTHTFILLENKAFYQFFLDHIGQMISFSAEIYRYYKKADNHNNLFYCKESLGLRNIKNPKKINKK